MVSSGGHARQQAPPLVHPSQRLHQEVRAAPSRSCPCAGCSSTRRRGRPTSSRTAGRRRRGPTAARPRRRRRGPDGRRARRARPRRPITSATPDFWLAAIARSRSTSGTSSIAADEAIVLVRRQLEPLALAPLQQRARARDDLLHVDRTRDEIVGARLQSAALALDAGIEHQHDGAAPAWPPASRGGRNRGRRHRRRRR